MFTVRTQIKLLTALATINHSPLSVEIIHNDLMNNVLIHITEHECGNFQLLCDKM